MNCTARRGSASRVPENSMAGPYNTVTQSISQIECVISVASVGGSVFFHDESLRRMVVLDQF